MLLRQKCDEEGSTFSDEGGSHDIYTVAEQTEDGKFLLYEQIGDVDKKGPHFANRKVIVDRDFIEELHKQLQR
jgi:hypothetical protein